MERLSIDIDFTSMTIRQAVRTIDDVIDELHRRRADLLEFDEEEEEYE